eukprot:360870-Chlamydomonas_euryale.AAC.10
MHLIPFLEGGVFCMSTVTTDFPDVCGNMRELCDFIMPHMGAALTTGVCSAEYQVCMTVVGACLDQGAHRFSLAGSGLRGARGNSTKTQEQDPTPQAVARLPLQRFLESF